MDDSDADKDYVPNLEENSSTTDNLSLLRNRKLTVRGRGVQRIHGPITSTPLKPKKVCKAMPNTILSPVSENRSISPIPLVFSESEDEISANEEQDLMDTGEDAQQDHYISSSADENDSSSDEEPWLDVEQDTVFPEPHVPFTENVNPKHMPPRDAPPIAYFNLFFTVSFISIIVTETNRYSYRAAMAYSYRVIDDRLWLWLDRLYNDTESFLVV